MADISDNPWSWSTSANSNSPSGTTNIGSGLDDNLRALGAGVKTLHTQLSSVAGTNTITASAAVAPTAYAASQHFKFIPANTNTGATTININSLGAKNIYAGGAALVGGELVANVPVEIEYDGTQFNIMGSILKSGAVDLSTGSLVGVKFDATQNASADANTLDDYEEGTWTCGLTFGGTSAGAFNRQTCSYTKVGNRVHVSGYVSLTSRGAGTGSAKLTAFPFTCANGDQFTSPLAIAPGQITFGGQMFLVMDTNATTASFIEMSEAGSRTDLTHADFADNSAIQFGGNYPV